MFKKNHPHWSHESMKEELTRFISLYKNRPIKENLHGMRFPHMFATYFILKKINPKFVIESGVYKGQSTWLIEAALPECKILCLDIDLKQIIYKSKKVTYSELDFKFQDFSNIPEETLVFFDDHQDHIERIKQAKNFNIKHIILEDNYPIGKGDFYTVRHSYGNKGFNHPLEIKSLYKTVYLFFELLIKKIFKKNYYISLEQISSRLRDRKPNNNDFLNLEKNLDIYYEFPPIIKIKNNKWNEDMTKPHLETEKEILDSDNIDFLDFKDELKNYNYITYIKLRA